VESRISRVESVEHRRGKGRVAQQEIELRELRQAVDLAGMTLGRGDRRDER